MNYEDFVSRPKSMVVAPAGYGKTHAIAECLKYTEGRQLILTHTHAGVASLKEKIQNTGIESNKYHVETITSFAQKYVNAFYRANDVPEQEGRDFYSFIIEKAGTLFRISPIQDVVRATYSGLFVDEYQDCTLNQHNLIQVLGSILKTHILGDPLQGIFGFNEPLVDFDNDLNDYDKFCDLSEPWRWKDKNPELGNSMKLIRESLEKHASIDLNSYKAHIEILQANEDDKYDTSSEYNKKIWDLIKEDKILIIHPDSTNPEVRIRFLSRFNNAFVLVEAIDDNVFYSFSKKFDGTNTSNVYHNMLEVVCDIFNKTEIDKWFNPTGVKNKKDLANKEIIQPIRDNIENLEQSISLLLISEVLKRIEKLPNVKCYRKELLLDLCSALEKAHYNNITVHDAMNKIRNTKRRTGRKLSGRCIGTTLLTKGLEFDTVVILDAHKYQCHKNFYVAITRARKKLIIFTDNTKLSPYKT